MKKISEACQQVLNNCEVSDKTVKLPEGQLDRPLYVEVQKVLAAAGGKWNRGQGVFLFPRDPRADLNLSLQSGQVQSTKKDTQAFYTPAAVAAEVYRHLPANMRGLRVYEPSAGFGALSLPALQRGARVTVQDIDPVSCGELDCQGYEGVIEGDFLLEQPEAKYDVILLNPPYTQNQDVDHVTHALKFLTPTGQLLAIMPASVRAYADSTLKKRKAFGELLAQQGRIVCAFDEGAFKESGTMVKTVLIELRHD